ncbi:MAG: hypothetical protein ACKO6L_02765, partial [Flavobacteriales bacterium]
SLSVSFQAIWKSKGFIERSLQYSNIAAPPECLLFFWGLKKTRMQLNKAPNRTLALLGFRFPLCPTYSGLQVISGAPVQVHSDTTYKI